MKFLYLILLFLFTSFFFQPSLFAQVNAGSIEPTSYLSTEKRLEAESREVLLLQSMKARHNNKLDSLARLGLKNSKHWVGEICVIRTIADAKYDFVPIIPDLKNGPSHDFSTIDLPPGFFYKPLYVRVLEVTKTGWAKVKIETSLRYYESFKPTGYVEIRFLN